jgi:hypothetical protein
VWYLNGVSVGTGDSLTFGSAHAAGYYRLDVTAYAEGGTRAGSATASFQVTDSGYPNGKLYVTSPWENRVYIVDPSTATTRVFLDQANGLITPMGVAADSGGRVYVVNSNVSPNPSFVQVFDPNGALIETLAGTGQVDYSVATDQSDQIFVAETTVGNQGIHVFDSSGNHLRKLDTSGDYAHTMAAGPDGYLYWWGGNARFVRFDKLVGSIGDPNFMEPPGHFGGIAFTPDSMVLGIRYAFSYGSTQHAIRKYNLNGQFLSELFATSDDRYIPWGVATHNGNIFVATQGGFLLTIDLENGGLKNALLIGTSASLSGITYSAR